MSSSNVVDASAAYYAGNSIGVGEDESLILSIDDFRVEILKAFSNSCGGVVNFDNGIIVGGTQSDQFRAEFADDKCLVVTSVDDLRTDFNAPAICKPISGPGEEPSGGFLAKSNVGDDQIERNSNYEFTFAEEGFGARENVYIVGGTILGRNGCPDPAKWMMKVTLDNGDIIASMAEVDFRTGNSRGDTFFGAKAPEGRHIVAVSWVNLNGTYSGLDGFAFITNGTPKRKKSPSDNNSSDDDFFGFSTPTYPSEGGSSGGGGGTTTLFGRPRR